MFTATGTLNYDPRSDASAFKSWWCKLTVPNSILYYYQDWIRKELKQNVNMPIWKGHVTVIRGEKPTKPWFWKKYEGEKIQFEYDPQFRMSETYFWLTVKCPRLEEIRVELGLKPQPKVPFHITIANTKNTAPIKQKPVTWVTFPWEL